MLKKILVADDERDIAQSVQIFLEQEGYQVATASDGCEVLECVARERPDAIILDVMMPNMDGIEVLRRLKENTETSSIPIIMLSAKGQDEDVTEGWRSGADLYLRKPFVPVQLLAFIKLVLE